MGVSSARKVSHKLCCIHEWFRRLRRDPYEALQGFGTWCLVVGLVYFVFDNGYHLVHDLHVLRAMHDMPGIDSDPLQIWAVPQH